MGIQNTGDGLLYVTIDSPPVNAIGMEVRQAIRRAIAEASSNANVQAVIIGGSGKLFSAGADITEFNKTPQHPQLFELVSEIERSGKPVIAVIHGACLGGGLEVALACHYRIATAAAMFGLPEVKLGLLPGSGGTQRLPRLIGTKSALDMIFTGESVSGTRALELGLVDLVVPIESLAEEASAFARLQSVPRRTGEKVISRDPLLFDRFRTDNARKISSLEAAAACVKAVQAATELPLREGLNLERELFLALKESEQSKGLRHIFLAERIAGKVSGVAKSVSPRPIARVGVIGAGTMGGGISMNFLTADIPVTLVETTQDALTRGVDTVRRNYAASVEKGRFTKAQVARALHLLTPTVDFGALDQCDFVIEAVYENMEVKEQVFSNLQKVARPGAILASNTSYLDIDRLAEFTDRPEDVLGLHFFSPANVMKLVEVVRGARTAPDALLTAMHLARRIGKKAVVSGVCYGFIGNRMMHVRRVQALELLLEGATPQQIDRVHTDFGMPMGPFQMTDLAGVDTGWHRDPSRVESIRDALCAAGRWGQKTKAGFYDYDDQRRPLPSAVTEQIIASFRDAGGHVPREIGEEEILVRTLYTMVNEGARIVEEGIAQRASDIDVVWVNGFGWPAITGGPMFWAETLGLRKLVDKLKLYRTVLGSGFTLSPLLAQRASTGHGFESEEQ